MRTNNSSNKKHKYDQYELLMTYSDFTNIEYAAAAYRNRKRKTDRKNRITYFKRQRSLGVVVAALGTFLLCAGCLSNTYVLQCFGATVGLVGLFLMLTKQMVVVDTYYLECQDRINQY